MYTLQKAQGEYSNKCLPHSVAAKVSITLPDIICSNKFHDTSLLLLYHISRPAVFLQLLGALGGHG